MPWSVVCFWSSAQLCVVKYHVYGHVRCTCSRAYHQLLRVVTAVLHLCWVCLTPLAHSGMGVYAYVVAINDHSYSKWHWRVDWLKYHTQLNITTWMANRWYYYLTLEVDTQAANTSTSTPHWWAPTRANSCLWVFHLLFGMTGETLLIPCQYGGVTSLQFMVHSFSAAGWIQCIRHIISSGT